MDETAVTPRFGHVAIVGRPNVGKSTLVNALVGARVTITSKKAQTTRHRVLGILTRPGAQFVFVDTPGFQQKHHSRLNERMNRTVRDSLSDVDVVVVVVEATKFTDADRVVLALLPRDIPVIAVTNKVDLLSDKATLLPYLAKLAAEREFAALVPVSADKTWQLDVLVAEIAKLLPEGPPQYGEDDLTDRDERFLAAEYIREKIFRLLGEEVPYATTVVIDSFQLDGALRRIHASIVVDRVSQRAILLGDQGTRMKSIATAARLDMERLFGGKVFLEIWVRVKSGWADNDGMLDRFGY